jgi:two-component sensor histidine kinase
VWAEDRIKASLKEKEVLLREIHHRVKNNLQVVSSLLDMQARRAGNGDLIDVLTESQNRINAMALIHTQLYESGDLSEINMKEFVDTLLTHLFRSCPVHGARITKTISVADYPVPLSIAVPIGLIVNELLSNILKHAFVGRAEGTIEVSLTASEEGKINLSVSDDGVGLPAGFDIDKTRTLGLRLIKILAEDQLQGTLGAISEEGTTFNIEFNIRTNDEV